MLLIGRLFTVTFMDAGEPYDGYVIAVLPAASNEGIPLWHMKHVDGDDEDLDAGKWWVVVICIIITTCL